ncbi:DUF2637 domain-containing protein [Streptomyces sp. NPDC088789]|uniref:DUF2637 domain-containing protein n=1 Tax=Streptomyces sp. NPDC088789 TaxID=3365899 RepID=UPI00382059C3
MTTRATPPAEPRPQPPQSAPGLGPGPRLQHGDGRLPSNRQRADRYVLTASGLVIITLTAGAFWLSYAHLAEVAGQHGLGHSPARQWAWPASLDAAIVAGELLMLRASFRKEVDWWAIALTTGGSLGSIALNIAGVTSTGEDGTVPVLDYVVAAVPPTAALIAFGVLMRQIHHLVVTPTTHHTTTPTSGAAPFGMPDTVTGTRAPTQRTTPAHTPDRDAGPQARSAGADQTGTTAADHLPTAGPPQTSTADHRHADQNAGVADHASTGPDHPESAAPDQSDLPDQPSAHHTTATLRTSITAGHTPDQAADHLRTVSLTKSGPRTGDSPDLPVNAPAWERTIADHGADQTAAASADQPAPDHLPSAADRPATAPDHERLPNPAALVRDHARTHGADHDQGGDELVPMERLIGIARDAALKEGRMTRRTIRPYLRAQDIQISNERFAELQTLLYQDPALTHLPRSQRKTR